MHNYFPIRWLSNFLQAINTPTGLLFLSPINLPPLLICPKYYFPQNPSYLSFSTSTMVVSSSSQEETLLYNVKLSSVGPGQMTRPDLTHEPTNINLAMKLHYLKGVYYFKSHEAFEGMTIMYIKESMFKWLNQFYVVCGRFRRSESGRPYIKCNDCGVRLIEAQCAKTIDEWLEMIKHDNDDYLKKMLIFSQPIGPQLAFSPNVFIQVCRMHHACIYI